tara:strand:- start:662 stop:856 length:195 start_codon:yes stop_codon:yes gene_type:complete
MPTVEKKITEYTKDLELIDGLLSKVLLGELTLFTDTLEKLKHNRINTEIRLHNMKCNLVRLHNL